MAGDCKTPAFYFFVLVGAVAKQLFEIIACRTCIVGREKRERAPKGEFALNSDAQMFERLTRTQAVSLAVPEFETAQFFSELRANLFKFAGTISGTLSNLLQSYFIRLDFGEKICRECP
jgi:hypothetical protein